MPARWRGVRSCGKLRGWQQRYGESSETTRSARSAEITHDLHTVASVRLDGRNRVWTDVVDTALV